MEVDMLGCWDVEKFDMLGCGSRQFGMLGCGSRHVGTGWDEEVDRLGCGSRHVGMWK